MSVSRTRSWLRAVCPRISPAPACPPLSRVSSDLTRARLPAAFAPLPPLQCCEDAVLRSRALHGALYRSCHHRCRYRCCDRLDCLVEPGDAPRAQRDVVEHRHRLAQRDAEPQRYAEPRRLRCLRHCPVIQRRLEVSQWRQHPRRRRLWMEYAIGSLCDCLQRRLGHGLECRHRLEARRGHGHPCAHWR
jgi:hypothetical protein